MARRWRYTSIPAPTIVTAVTTPANKPIRHRRPGRACMRSSGTAARQTAPIARHAKRTRALGEYGRR